MYALFVNGGEVTALNGIFSDRKLIDPIIAEMARVNGLTHENGYTVGSIVNSNSDSRVSYVHVYEESIYGWALLFTIMDLTVDEQCDIGIL